MRNTIYYLKSLLNDINYTLAEHCAKLSKLYILSDVNDSKEVSYLEGQVDSLIKVKNQIEMEIKVCQNI